MNSTMVNGWKFSVEWHRTGLTYWKYHLLSVFLVVSFAGFVGINSCGTCSYFGIIFGTIGQVRLVTNKVGQMECQRSRQERFLQQLKVLVSKYNLDNLFLWKLEVTQTGLVKLLRGLTSQILQKFQLNVSGEGYGFFGKIILNFKLIFKNACKIYSQSNQGQ